VSLVFVRQKSSFDQMVFAAKQAFVSGEFQPGPPLPSVVMRFTGPRPLFAARGDSEFPDV